MIQHTPTTTAHRAIYLTAALAFLFIAAAWPSKAAMGAEGVLELTVVDSATGETVPCRMHLRTAAGQIRKAPKTPSWHDHFVVPGRITLKLPLGTYIFEIERGLEYRDYTGHFVINRFADDSKTVELHRFVDMSEQGWWSGDLDVRRPLREIELLMQSDDLHVAEVVSSWGEKGTQQASPKESGPLVAFDGDRFYHALAGEHARPGGRWLYFNLPEPILLPDARSEFPSPVLFCQRAQRQPGGWVDAACAYAWDLPMLVAAGQIDSIEVANHELHRVPAANMTANVRQRTRPEVGPTWGKPRDRRLYPGAWGSARWAQDVYFHLLDCGLRIPPTAGSGSGGAPNPVGYNRVYAYVDGELTYEKWWDAVRAGRVTVTNGPLLMPSVEGQLPGHVFSSQAGRPIELEPALTLSTRDKISYLEVIKDGEVAHSVPLDEYAKTGKLPKVRFDSSGWFLIRAVADMQETYRFAITGPYYVEIDGRSRISRRSAKFFLDWVDERAGQIHLDDADAQAQVLAPYHDAHKFWQNLVDRASAE